jgi:hypothetical protein
MDRPGGILYGLFVVDSLTGGPLIPSATLAIMDRLLVLILPLLSNRPRGINSSAIRATIMYASIFTSKPLELSMGPSVSGEQ